MSMYGEGFSFYNKAVGKVPRHLNIVLGVHPRTDEHLVVNVTTGAEGYGPIFTPHMWAKLDRPSQIAMRTARVVTLGQMVALDRGHLWQATSSPPRGTLLAMRDAFLGSPHSSTALKAFLRECS